MSYDGSVEVLPGPASPSSVRSSNNRDAPRAIQPIPSHTRGAAGESIRSVIGSRDSPIQIVDLPAEPLAIPPVGHHPPILIDRLLQRFNCGLQELRMMLLLMPAMTVLCFVQGQKIAGGILLSFTLLLLIAVCLRLGRVLRAHNQMLYAQVPGQLHRRSLGELRRLNPHALSLMMQDRDFTPADYETLQRLDEEHKANTFTGIPLSQIERLPTYQMGKTTHTEDVSCTICLEDRLEGELVRSLLCMHTFHAACIDPWLKTSQKVSQMNRLTITM
jgi:hypothetical protein